MVPEPLTLKTLEQYFPFEGVFHFRLKIPGKLRKCDEEYIWFDLRKENINVPIPVTPNIPVEIQAIALELDIQEDQDFDEIEDDHEMRYLEYWNDLEDQLNLEGSRSDRQSVDIDNLQSAIPQKKKSSIFHKMKKSIVSGGMKGAVKAQAFVDNISLESVAKGASSIWKSMLQGASNILSINNSSSALSDLAENNLADLSEELSSIFSDNDSAHIHVLSSLWTELFPSGS
jgi:hypothetical protein